MNQILKFRVGGICLVLAGTTAVAADKPFPDVPRNHWAYEILLDLQKEGLLAGWPDGFIYHAPVPTRQPVATAIVATYRKIEQIDGELSAQVTSLVTSVDLTVSGAKTEQLQAEAALLHELNDARGWGDDFHEFEKLAKAFRRDVADAGGNVEAMCRDLEAIESRLDYRNPNSYWARIDTAFSALAKRHETYPDIPENHWVFQALQSMKRDGLLVVPPPDPEVRHARPAKRREIAEAVVATYKRLKHLVEKLDAEIKEFSESVDREESRNKLVALVKELDSMKPWGDDIPNLSKLVREFKPDIAAMGEDVEAMLSYLGDLRDRTCSLESAGFKRKR